MSAGREALDLIKNSAEIRQLLDQVLIDRHDPKCIGWIPFDDQGGWICCSVCNLDLRIPAPITEWE